MAAVSVKLKGRLGNQAFQIATCIAFALKHNIDYIIPEHTENDEVWPHAFPHLITQPKFSAGCEFLSYITYKEPSHEYTEIPFNKEWEKPLIVLDGYFQSFKYFEGYKNELKEILGFAELPLYKKNVHVHIRRKDYLLYPEKHPVVTLDYLKQAINHFDNKEYNFLVFSDDINWCQQNITPDLFKSNNYLAFVNPDNSALKDLYSYACANNYIIANSTYSLIGSYFSKATGKIICPHENNWFGPGNANLSTRDLLPKEWIRIKY